MTKLKQRWFAGKNENPEALGWASRYIKQLTEDETVSFRPRGNSMVGKIESGQLCAVEPVDSETLKVADIVLCKVKGHEHLHLVKAIQGQRFQIVFHGLPQGNDEQFGSLQE